MLKNKLNNRVKLYRKGKSPKQEVTEEMIEKMAKQIWQELSVQFENLDDEILAKSFTISVSNAFGCTGYHLPTDEFYIWRAFGCKITNFSDVIDRVNDIASDDGIYTNCLIEDEKGIVMCHFTYTPDE